MPGPEDRREQGSWLKSLSVVRCFRMAFNSIADSQMDFVNQRVVLSFLCWDALVFAGMTAFYFEHQDVAILGLLSQAKNLCLLGTFRVATVLFGFIAVLQRRLSRVQVFYALFLLQLVLLVLFIVPVLGSSLVCSCDKGTWEQCNAMQSFAEDGLVLNYKPMPLHIPDDHPYNSKPGGRMLIEAPPSQAKPWTPSSSSETARPHRLHKRVLGRLNLDPEPTPLMQFPTPGDGKWSPVNFDDGLHFLSSSTGSGPSLLQNSSNAELGLEAKLKEPEAKRNNDDVAAKMAELMSARAKQDSEFSETVKNGPQTTIKAHDTVHPQDQDGELMVKPESKVQPKYAKPRQRDLVNASEAEAMTRLKLFFDNSCRCADESSCRYHSSAGGATYWCYVDEASVKHCQRDGIKLLKDKNGKPWSKDLCNKRSCTCAGIGMLPGYHFAREKTADPELQTSAMNYGSHCKKWDKNSNDTYAFNWCYAHFDTTCVERIRRPAPNAENTIFPQGLPYMFQSYEACSSPSDSLREVRNGRLAKAKEVCELVQLALQVLLWLHLALTLPMTVVMYHFVSNQCSDSFAATDHFATISDSEEEASSKCSFVAGESHDPSGECHGQAQDADW